MSIELAPEKDPVIEAGLSMLELDIGQDRQWIYKRLDEEPTTISNSGELAAFLGVVLDLNGEAEAACDKRAIFSLCLGLVQPEPYFALSSSRSFEADELAAGFADDSPSRLYVRLGEYAQAGESFIIRNDSKLAEAEANLMSPWTPLKASGIVHLGPSRQERFVKADVNSLGGKKIYDAIEAHCQSCSACAGAINTAREVRGE